jgi:fructose-bisphosphate aldolase, class II
MPLVTDYNQVKEIYEEAQELGVALPVFCAEDRETIEAILISALEYGNKIGVNNIPVIPAWTSRYPPRGQMTLVSRSGNAVLGNQLMFSDLSIFTGNNSPYKDLRVMPHLDHAFPWLDRDILEGFTDKFASVMFDASERPFQENIKLTSEFVEKVKGRVIVEGSVNEISEAGVNGVKNECTTVEQAAKFLRETGVDLIVPNVGTEHRSTTDQVIYNSDRAKEISNRIGKIMCLHGTSSLNAKDLTRLPEDGFIKINIYTTLAVSGGQALTRKILNNLGNIFSENDLKELIMAGVLGENVSKADFKENIYPIRPKLDYVTNPLRRDAWSEAVKNKCLSFYEVFNYKNYAK